MSSFPSESRGSHKNDEKAHVSREEMWLFYRKRKLPINWSSFFFIFYFWLHDVLVVALGIFRLCSGVWTRDL